MNDQVEAAAKAMAKIMFPDSLWKDLFDVTHLKFERMARAAASHLAAQPAAQERGEPQPPGDMIERMLDAFDNVMRIELGYGREQRSKAMRAAKKVCDAARDREWTQALFDEALETLPSQTEAQKLSMRMYTKRLRARLAERERAELAQGGEEK